MATLCVSGDVLFQAGGKVSGDNLVEADYDRVIEDAEGKMSVAAKEDLITAYASASAHNQKFLRETCSKLAAIELVKYDMGNYSSRIEAEDIINILRDAALLNLSLLKDRDFVNFIKT